MHFPPPSPTLRKILIGLCASYIVSMLALRAGGGVWITHLEPSRMRSFEVKFEATELRVLT